MVKAKFGPRTERLVHFNMVPIRKRRKKTDEEKPVDGEVTGSKPATKTPKSVD